MAIDYSTSESQAKSWADLIATIVVHDGLTIEDVDLSALSWGATRSRGTQRKHGRKYARTRGTTDYSGSATFFDSGWEPVRRALLAVATAKNLEIFDVPFDIIAKRKPVDSTTVETAVLENCCLNEASADYAEGDDPDQHTVALDVMRVFETESGSEVTYG
jgi:hypothetical protein